MAFKHLLVPVDFSDSSLSALRKAAEIAKESGAKLTLLHVGLAPELYYGDLAAYGFLVPETTTKVREQVVAEQKQAMERIRREQVPADVPCEIVLREGYAPDEICAQVKAGGYDAVVMGTHGRSGITRALLGSVTERVLRHCEIPVLVTR